MSFYVSALYGRQYCLGLGPFRRHGDALRLVTAFRHWANENTREGHRGFVAYGTCRHKTEHPPGKFNSHFNINLDSSGYVLGSRWP